MRGCEGGEEKKLGAFFHFAFAFSASKPEGFPEWFFQHVLQGTVWGVRQFGVQAWGYVRKGVNMPSWVVTLVQLLRLISCVSSVTPGASVWA